MHTSVSTARQKLIADLRKVYAELRPPRMRGMGKLMELDLTIPQLKVMFLLLDSAPARMSFIAQEMDITMSACTHLVDRLVTAGHVQRSEDPDDRRVVQCSLTEPGRATLDELRQQTPFEDDEFVSRLTDEELQVCLHAAQIYKRVIAEMGSA